MPRIRSVKPEIWDDVAVGEVSLHARLLFVGLITQADDDGYLPGNPKWIDSKIFPYDELSTDEIQKWVQELDSVGLIHHYEVDGKAYIRLPSWENHQSVDKRYHTPTKLPGAPAERSPQVPQSRDESTPPDRSGEDRSGEEGIGESEIEIPDAPLSDLLASLVAENTGNAPTITKAWIDAERLMLGKDGRDADEAERLIRWTQRDEFWRANVLSLPKFRAKYDQLLLTAKRGKGGDRAGMDNAHRFAQKAAEARAREGASA